MKKIKFSLILFLIFFYSIISSYSSETIKSKNTNCIISADKNLDQLSIAQIDIDLDDYRKWTKNSLKIIIGNFRYIPSKFKKRFKAKLIVSYKNNTQCVFKAEIRHSGDEKDHVNLKDNLIYQSIDVHLKEGNIRGITKFKLLRPKTRGKLEDEIFLTEILRQLNYLAPRTILVKTRINESFSNMIFQEKAAKELLEFNNRREGPILEGDERFFFTLAEKLPDNNISNWSIGLVPILNKSIKAMLAKQVNANIISKSLNHKMMSYNSVSNLNLIYLHYSNSFQDKRNNYDYFDYDLDNSLLALFDDDNILKLDIYNLLIQATNSQHGLAPNNRKFYWNSLERYFEPINYDSNSNIDTSPNVLRLPATKIFPTSFNALKTKLTEINIDQVYESMKFSGISLSKKDLRSKLNKIMMNINKIEDFYLKENKELIEYNRFKYTNKNLLENLNKTFEKINPKTNFVKHGKKNEDFQKCNLKLNDCVDLKLSEKQISDLLEGELVINGEDYQYTGNISKLEDVSKYSVYKEYSFENTKIIHDDGIDLKVKLKERVIDIYQTKPGSRIYFIDGELNNVTINFNGFDKKIKINNNTPIDINGLTGCVSLINLNLKNIKINSNNSTCEDSINLINVKGNLLDVKIINSLMDGLDIDFSDVSIDNIFISGSNNDCLDLSYGNYHLGNVKLYNCGDKGLSVGEKSIVYNDYIEVQNTDIGIASKDSSLTKLNTVNLKKTKTCVSAYKKKQEFNGGYLSVKNLNCIDYYKKIDVDNFSEIKIQNEL